MVRKINKQQNSLEFGSEIQYWKRDFGNEILQR
jgi:hypothetical protein